MKEVGKNYKARNSSKIRIYPGDPKGSLDDYFFGMRKTYKTVMLSSISSFMVVSMIPGDLKELPDAFFLNYGCRK